MTYDELDEWARGHTAYAQECFRDALADHDYDAVLHVTIKPGGAAEAVFLKPDAYAHLPVYRDVFPPPRGQFVFAVGSGGPVVFWYVPIPWPEVGLLAPKAVCRRSPSVN